MLPRLKALDPGTTSLDSILSDAIQFLQLETIENLRKDNTGLKVKNEEAETRLREQNEEILKKEAFYKKKIDDKQHLVDYVMNVLQKGEQMMQLRQNVIDKQAQYIDDKNKKLEECQIMKNDIKATLIENQETLRNHTRLENMLKTNDRLTSAYERINKDNVAKNNCTIPGWVSGLTEALSVQKEQIDELTSHIGENSKIEEQLSKIHEEILRIDIPVSSENITLMSNYHSLLKQQSTSISMFRNIMSNTQNTTCALRYAEDDNGILLSAKTCHCLPGA